MSATDEAIAEQLAADFIDKARSIYAEGGICWSFIDGPDGGRDGDLQPMQIAG